MDQHHSNSIVCVYAAIYIQTVICRKIIKINSSIKYHMVSLMCAIKKQTNEQSKKSLIETEMKGLLT